MPKKSPSKSKQQIGARVDPHLATEVRILALRQGRRFNDLVEEAMRDLLKKHGGRDKRAV